MPIRHVRQEHYDGCFVACVAMLLKVSYREAFEKVYPNRDFYAGAGLHPHLAMRKLEALGFQFSYAKTKRLSSLKKDALLCIHWEGSDTGHAVLFDSRAKKFLDPAYAKHLPLSEYERQISFIICFDGKPKRKKKS